LKMAAVPSVSVRKTKAGKERNDPLARDDGGKLQLFNPVTHHYVDYPGTVASNLLSGFAYKNKVKQTIGVTFADYDQAARAIGFETLKEPTSRASPGQGTGSRGENLSGITVSNPNPNGRAKTIDVYSGVFNKLLENPQYRSALAASLQATARGKTLGDLIARESPNFGMWVKAYTVGPKGRAGQNRPIQIGNEAWVRLVVQDPNQALELANQPTYESREAVPKEASATSSRERSRELAAEIPDIRVVNPEGGRKIKYGGPTYLKLTPAQQAALTTQFRQVAMSDQYRRNAAEVEEIIALVAGAKAGSRAGSRTSSRTSSRSPSRTGSPTTLRATRPGSPTGSTTLARPQTRMSVTGRR